jgi:protein-L-isoaspartate O-methyltransferase
VNKNILNTDVQMFINENINSNIHSLILKGSVFKDVNIQEIIEQIEAKKKCKLKLQTWFKTSNIYFPNKLNIEQTSSETTAIIKSNLIKGKSLLDLTGGFGVDSYYFSKKFRSITHCESIAKLAKIAAHNFMILNADNITSVCYDGKDFLKNYKERFDWIYIDPSRRDHKKNKKTLIEDCSPNIMLIEDLIYEKTNKVLIKMSPMLDISKAIQLIKNVNTVYIVAVKNEVKELLFHLEKDNNSEVNITTINYHLDKTEHFSFKIHQEKTAKAKFSTPKQFLYEPNAAVMKSGAFRLVSKYFKLYKLDINTHLYTSERKIKNFPGKIYEIISTHNYHKKSIRQIIRGRKANLKTRNFPEKNEVLKKHFKISDGGENYLFFTSNLKNKIVIDCQLA